MHSCDDKIPHLFSLVKRFYVDFYIFVKITPTFFVVICRAAFARNAFACQPLKISFGIFLKPRRRASDLQPPPRANRALQNNSRSKSRRLKTASMLCKTFSEKCTQSFVFFFSVCYNIKARGCGSAGRAMRSQRIGRGFESLYLHQRRLGLESYRKRFDKNSQAFFLCCLLLSPTYLFCFGSTK